MKRNYLQPKIDTQTCLTGNHLCAASSLDQISVSSQTIDPGTIGD